MSYIGTPPSNAFTSLLKQDFSTSATTGYTLDHAVNNANDIALFINFVRQEPTAGYAASGTSLVLTSATASSDDMYCVYLGQALQTVNPANASVGISQLSATGTKNSTTFLRGDNTFAEAGGGLNLLATTTCSDTSAVTFNGLFSSTYKNYMVQYSDIVNNGTDIAIRIRFRISDSDVTSSNYHWNRNNIATNSSSTVNQVSGDWNQSYISAGGISINGSASEYYKGNGYFYLYNPLGTDNYKFLQGEQNQMNADDTYIQNVRYVGNLHSAVTALSGLTIYPDTANFTTGTIKLYGIK